MENQIVSCPFCSVKPPISKTLSHHRITHSCEYLGTNIGIGLGKRTEIIQKWNTLMRKFRIALI